ncbi:hypothetical protein BS78_07G093600 [Paspalum vaginatum]|nr:hypothetical protein BS78_07G093600 [Paspalum vaginatum]
MASSSPRTCRTSSVSSVETAQGTHSFKITSYSLHKKVSVDKRFCSAPFAVGGHDPRLAQCDVTVIKEVQVKQETQQTAETSDFESHDLRQLRPSDLSHDLGRLLESEEGADVAFKVQGEVFRAHKVVLAMRSPVFKAQLFGPMSDGKGMAETGQDDPRFGMERMKLICESILCKSLDAGSVAYTLALAGQHHCSKLKNACFEFIVPSDGMDAVLASKGTTISREHALMLLWNYGRKR